MISPFLGNSGVIYFNLSFRCPVCCWYLPQLWLWPVTVQHLWTTNKWLGQDSSRKTGNSASCNSSELLYKVMYFNITHRSTNVYQDDVIYKDCWQSDLTFSISLWSSWYIGMKERCHKSPCISCTPDFWLGFLEERCISYMDFYVSWGYLVLVLASYHKKKSGFESVSHTCQIY